MSDFQNVCNWNFSYATVILCIFHSGPHSMKLAIWCKRYIKAIKRANCKQNAWAKLPDQSAYLLISKRVYTNRKANKERKDFLKIFPSTNSEWLLEKSDNTRNCTNINAKHLLHEVLLAFRTGPVSTNTSKHLTVLSLHGKIKNIFWTSCRYK